MGKCTKVQQGQQVYSGEQAVNLSPKNSGVKRLSLPEFAGVIQLQAFVQLFVNLFCTREEPNGIFLSISGWFLLPFKLANSTGNEPNLPPSAALHLKKQYLQAVH